MCSRFTNSQKSLPVLLGDTVRKRRPRAGFQSPLAVRVQAKIIRIFACVEQSLKGTKRIPLERGSPFSGFKAGAHTKPVLQNIYFLIYKSSQQSLPALSLFFTRKHQTVFHIYPNRLTLHQIPKPDPAFCLKRSQPEFANYKNRLKEFSLRIINSGGKGRSEPHFHVTSAQRRREPVSHFKFYQTEYRI